MQRDVLFLPHAALDRVADPVGVVDDAVRAVCRDLVDTMRAARHSVGVAAPQIGVSLRVFCLDVTGHPKAHSCHGKVVLVNPELLDGRDAEVGREGCMSVPDLTGDVPRATRVAVRGLTPEGEVRVIEADGFEARAIQHELDHLDGKLFLDRVLSARHVYARKRFR